MLYPLKFKPILKQTIWGGDKLAYKSNDPKVKESIGESWEISGVQDNISVVSEGALEGNSLQELTEIYMGDLVGDKIYEKFGSFRLCPLRYKPLRPPEYRNTRLFSAAKKRLKAQFP